MPGPNHALASDEAFERELLRAGESDPLPPQDERAWHRFSALLAAAAAGNAAAAPLTTAAPIQPLSARALRGLALKWLVVGTVLGSAITWRFDAWRAARRSELSAAQNNTLAVAPSPADATAPAGEVTLRAPALGAAPSTRAPEARPGAAPAAAPFAKERGAAGVHKALPPLGKPAPLASVSSTLSAEVAALDYALAAAQRGDNDEALRRIALYHRNFPEGVLRADADAAAIEMLSAAGRSTAAARLAERFLANYPNDPHAANVRRSLRE
jgi:hypothetical protein